MSDKSYAIPLVRQRVSKQSTWKRRILLTVSSAPVQGIPMIMTEAYRRILERAANGQLPPWVVEQSEPDFRVIRALYEEKCLVGLHVSAPNHGGAYVHLRLSRKGRAIYQRVRAAFPST